MGIRFLCEHCGKKLNIKDELAGKKGRCPKCNERIEIPAESTLESTKAPAGQQPVRENVEKERAKVSVSAKGSSRPVGESRKRSQENQSSKGQGIGLPLPATSCSLTISLRMTTS